MHCCAYKKGELESSWVAFIPAVHLWSIVCFYSKHVQDVVKEDLWGQHLENPKEKLSWPEEAGIQPWPYGELASAWPTVVVLPRTKGQACVTPPWAAIACGGTSAAGTLQEDLHHIPPCPLHCVLQSQRQADAVSLEEGPWHLNPEDEWHACPQ